MLLNDLLAVDDSCKIISNSSNYNIDNIAFDSRKITINSLFFAIKGNNSNGLDYIDSAIKKGAVAIIIEKDTLEYVQKNSDIANITLVTCSNIRKNLSLIAAKFYNNDFPENIVAVTGTNGKTSVAFFYYHLMNLLGYKAAYIGTLGVISNIDISKYKSLFQHNLTSPDPISLYNILNILKQEKVEHVAIAASSHGLDQDRLIGLHINAAAFTNFTQDHLDYHHTMDNYFDAKMKLFSAILPKNTHAVINSDIDEYEKIKNICLKHHQNIIDYGYKAQSLKIIKSEFNNLGYRDVEILYNKQIYKFKFKQLANYQVYNLICAIGLALGNNRPQRSNFNLKDIFNVIEKIPQVSGRMELIENDKNLLIYVDYAHTPDALENVLKELNKVKNNKNIYTIFGCGGDRDRTKRNIMGKIACYNSDYVIVTNDNPRTENPKNIIADIIKNHESWQKEHHFKLEIIEDRHDAINFALKHASSGSIILVAGKGHEDYQIIGDKKIPFHDPSIIKLCIKNLSNV